MRGIVTKQGKYKEWIEPDGLLTIKGWARDGLTDIEITKNIGISMATFTDWKKKFPVILAALKEGRRPAIIEVEDTFFEKKLKGYFVEEEIVEVTKNGNNKVEHRKKIKRWIPPDTTAMIFYLKCRKPQQYNDKQALSADSEATNGKLDQLIEAVKEI